MGNAHPTVQVVLDKIKGENMSREDLLKRKEELELDLKDASGSKCEVYSRVVGYHRPVDNWNDGKKHEYCNRQEFDKTAKVI